MRALRETFFLLILPLVATAGTYPSWWVNRGVVNTNAAATNDYAAANEGELKWIALGSVQFFVSP